MLRVDQIAIMRHKVLAEGRSLREVAAELGVSRNTVRRYVRAAPPAAVRSMARRSPVTELVGPRIDELLAEWASKTTRKQRITGTRVHRALVAEGKVVGLTTVRKYLAAKRRAEAEVYIPLVHRPGDAGQVDYFEVTVCVAGVRQTAHMFQLSLPYSDRDFAWICAYEDLPSFLEGHVRAFAHLGGSPARLVYDNSKLAVNDIVGSQRVLNAHFARLAAHFAFEPDFARVGTGHDKGAIEVRGKRSRLTHLVPVPEGETLEAINTALLAALDEQAAVRRNVAGRTVLERFAEEAALFVALPAEPFEARVPARVGANRQSLVRLGGGTYSLPCHWARREVMAWIGAADIRFEWRGETELVARTGPGGKQIRYLHYLPELAKKPKAVRQVAPELMAELGGCWPALWERLQAVHGPAQTGKVVAALLAVLVAEGDPELEALLNGAMASAEPPVAEPPAASVVAVPAGLQHLAVEQTPATAYDQLLMGSEA
jgi:transposase